MRMIARAKMGENDQLVLETIGSLDHVIEMHVPELVDLFAAMAGPDEADLGNENLGLVNGWVVIQAGRTRVAAIGHERRSSLAGHARAAEAEISNLLAGQAVIFFLEFEPAIPNDTAKGRDRVRRR